MEGFVEVLLFLDLGEIEFEGFLVLSEKLFGELLDGKGFAAAGCTKDGDGEGAFVPRAVPVFLDEAADFVDALDFVPVHGVKLAIGCGRDRTERGGNAGDDGFDGLGEQGLGGGAGDVGEEEAAEQASGRGRLLRLPDVYCFWIPCGTELGDAGDVRGVFCIAWLGRVDAEGSGRLSLVSWLLTWAEGEVDVQRVGASAASLVGDTLGCKGLGNGEEQGVGGGIGKVTGEAGREHRTSAEVGSRAFVIPGVLHFGGQEIETMECALHKDGSSSESEVDDDEGALGKIAGTGTGGEFLFDVLKRHVPRKTTGQGGIAAAEGIRGNHNVDAVTQPFFQQKGQDPTVVGANAVFEENFASVGEVGCVWSTTSGRSEKPKPRSSVTRRSARPSAGGVVGGAQVVDFRQPANRAIRQTRSSSLPDSRRLCFHQTE